jgi:hypothetical protein
MQRIRLRAMCAFLGALAEWLKTNESVAVWLEGIALVAILALDWRERIDQRKERHEQHKETAAQLAASQKQVEAAIRSADAATASAAAATATIKLMRRISRKELRARVFVLGAKRLGMTSGPGPFDAEITIKNFGKIPAYRCTYRVAIILATNPVPEDQIPALQRTGQEPRIVLPPEGEVTVIKTLPLDTFSNTQHTQVGQGSFAVYIHGEILYRDGFGKERVSKFRMKCCESDYALRRFSFCERGNEAN